MKKIFILTFASLFLLSCSNDDSKESFVNESQIKAMMKINDSDDQKLAYGLLNEYEKATVWKEHFTDLLLNDATLTQDQKDIIEEVSGEITHELFSDDMNDTKAAFYAIIAPGFLLDIQVAFPVWKAEKVFHTLNAYAGGSGSTKTCNCNQGSMFGCGATNDCGSTKCDEPSKNDWGFLWMYPCDGLCKIF
jgi:hypothetical protein